MSKAYVIGGSDSFAVKERTKSLLVELAGENYAENPALEIIDGDAETAEKVFVPLLSALRTPPFLVPRKIVYLRNFIWFDALSDKTPAADALMEFLTSPLPEELDCILEVAELDQRSSAAKALKKAVAVWEIYAAAKSSDRDYESSRRGVMNEILQSAGKTIAGNAAQYLLEVVGGDSGNWRNELEKLVVSVGDAEKITLPDAMSVISRTPEAVSWALNSAITGGDREGALTLLDQMLRQNEHPIRLAAMISNEYQRLVQTKLSMKKLNLSRVNPRTFDNIPQEVRDGDPGNPLLKMHPYRAFKVCEAAMRIPDEELPEKIRAITGCSIALVSSGGDPRILLENLIIRLTERK